MTTVLWLVPSLVMAQAQLLSLYEKNEIAKLEDRLRSGDLNQSNDIYSQFIAMIFTRDADRAIDQMKGLIQQNPQNPVLPALLERIAQYQFSVGLYNTAHETFEYLVAKYPNQRYGESGMYYLVRCWQAIGRTDSSRSVLEQFLRQYPHSKFTKAAYQDLKEGTEPVAGQSETKSTVIKPTQLQSIFTIQTGAFTTEANARLQEQFLEDKGYQAVILMKSVQQKNLFVVCIGRFQDKDQAESYGKSIAQKYKFDFQIVDLGQLQPLR